MDSSELNFDIPDTGAIFSFGKNVPNKFYVKSDKIISMDCGEGHAAMVTSSGRVFVFGQNDYGQLGVGSKATQAKPACVKQLKEDNIKATKVACGPTHTLVLADDGIVYGFGNNSDGQITGDESEFIRPVEIDQLDRIEVRELAAGRAFSLAVSRKGELFAWGGNAEGCLGQDDPDLPGSPDPLPIHLPGRVATISAGSYHCACVLTDGRLFAWGETERGKLGIRNAEDNEYIYSPQQVQLPGHERVQMVSCGQQHTLVLTESGKVFACGSGEAGQLGMGAACTYAPTLKLVTGLEKIKVACVSAGERHSMCVCAKTGQVYAFGDTIHGKLGVKPASSTGGGRFSSSSAAASCLFEPTLVAVLKPVSAQQVVCGTLLTSVLAVPSKSKQSGAGRPGSSASDNENDDQLPALKGRSSSLGRSNSFQDNGGPASSAAAGKGGRGGLAPLAINGTGAGSSLASSQGRLDKSGRFSPIGLRGGSTSPRYSSDNDAMKPLKKLDPISGKRPQDDLNAASRRSRNSVASTKFDSLINGPSDSNSDSDDGKRLKGPAGASKLRGSGAKSPAPVNAAGSRSAGTTGLASRRGLAPLKLRSDDDSGEDSDGPKGGKAGIKAAAAGAGKKQRGRLRSDSPPSPPPLSSRRGRLSSVETGKGAGGIGGKKAGRRFSDDDNKAGTDDEEVSNKNSSRSRRRRGGRDASPNSQDSADDGKNKKTKKKEDKDDNHDDGAVKGVGCMRPRARRVGDEEGEEKRSRSCQLL